MPRGCRWVSVGTPLGAGVASALREPGVAGSPRGHPVLGQVPNLPPPHAPRPTPEDEVPPDQPEGRALSARRTVHPGHVIHELGGGWCPEVWPVPGLRLGLGWAFAARTCVLWPELRTCCRGPSVLPTTGPWDGQSGWPPSSRGTGQALPEARPMARGELSSPQRGLKPRGQDIGTCPISGWNPPGGPGPGPRGHLRSQGSCVRSLRACPAAMGTAHTPSGRLLQRFLQARGGGCRGAGGRPQGQAAPHSAT